MNYLDSLLERLTNATNVGYGGDVGAVIAADLQGLRIAVEKSDDGSVYATAPGTEKNSIMIACHLDEVGFIVNSIDDDNGFIRFTEYGGTDKRILIGQQVIIHGRNDIRAYIGAKPPHLQTVEEKRKVFQVEDLFIDCGLPASEVKKNVQIGDIITFSNRYLKMQNSMRSAKSLDNRASIAAAILALRELRDHKNRATVHFVATSQEEFTGLGARISSNRLDIKCAIVLDVTFGNQPDLAETESFALENGPAIGRGGFIPDKLYRLLVDAAKALEIPYQIEPMPSVTGTDIDTIAFNREGIPCALISIPVRYMHTPVEVVSLKDIERASRLLAEFVKRWSG